MLSLQSQVPSVLTLFTPWPPVSVTVVHTLHSRDVSIVTRYCIKQSIVSGPRLQICQSQVAKICKPFIQDFAQAASPRTSGLLLRPHWTLICVTRTQEYKSSWYSLLSSVSAWASILPSKGSYSLFVIHDQWKKLWHSSFVQLKLFSLLDFPLRFQSGHQDVGTQKSVVSRLPLLHPLETHSHPLHRCRWVTHFREFLDRRVFHKLTLLFTSAVSGVTGVPERICSIIQAQPDLLRSQALLTFLLELSSESHLGPNDVTAMDTE